MREQALALVGEKYGGAVDARFGPTLTASSQRKGHRVFFYACTAYHKRGTAVCGNGLTLPIDRVEEAVLQAIGIDVLRQQARFDTFLQRYNDERPHQAPDMKTPATLYTPSTRGYGGLEELKYPGHDWTAVITTCGRICYQRSKIM